MIQQKVYSVSQINRYIRGVLEKDFILNSLWIRGEISNFKSRRGHLYFTLKDEGGAIQCVMFEGSACLLPFVPENGMEVMLLGYVSLYEKTGQYQFYAELMEPVGLGALNTAFEQLKEKLKAEGLFDEDYKREICKTPKEITIVTSPKGAALQDMLQIAGRRNPQVKISVVPVLVQGEKAADSIVSGLRLANEWKKADTIIVGRGGGSLEDLWAFNEEKVAKAIFASEIPVISAVGHETDFTIADFVSDLRAPTPSAAAELAVNDIYETVRVKEKLLLRLKEDIKEILFKKEEKLETLMKKRCFSAPLEKIQSHEIYLAGLLEKIEKEQKRLLEKKEERFLRSITHLEALSPFNILKRGYSVVYRGKNEVVTSKNQLQIGEEVFVKLREGEFSAKVNGVGE